MNFIGNHGCSKTPASLFNENDGTLRAAGTKASLVKVLIEETCVTAVPNLPDQNLKTAVVVDAIYAVCRWSFFKDETFGAVARLYKNHLPTDIPNGTDSIHFCRDRYNHLSLHHMYAGRDKLSNLRSVSITQSPTNNIYSLYLPTRPDFLNFLCERWCDEEQLGGGFKDDTKSVLVTAGIVTDVAALESTQKEADTRVILHFIHSVQKEDVERIIIHTNDTYTVVISYMCDPARKRLKSRHSFLHSVEPLDGIARTRRLTLWSSHLQTTPHKLSFIPKESLPPGSSETWPTWSSLNRLRTGTGRCKSLMQKWGFNEDGQTTCECGNEQTMKHLLVCPILPQPCTHDDLEEFNPRARSCAQHWAGVV